MSRTSADIDVTIIVATYNRPDHLRHAIHSVQAQTYPGWKLLIIGDACTPETGGMIAGLDDSRIEYINLKNRFGEQAGPNSVGMALAETPYIAFLNHDDLWLPDHLSRGIDALSGQDEELYISKAAFYKSRGRNSSTPLFLETHPDDRHISQSYTAANHLFEPMSSWIGTREMFQRIGPMTLSSHIDVFPLQDYVRRMAISEVPVCFGSAITVLKLQRVSGYDASEAHFFYLADLIRENRASKIYDMIEENLHLAHLLGAARKHMAPSGKEGHPGDPLSLHRDCAIDIRSTELSARQAPDTHLRRSLMQRVGETIETQPDLQEAIRHARG